MLYSRWKMAFDSAAIHAKYLTSVTDGVSMQHTRVSTNAHLRRGNYVLKVKCQVIFN